MSKGEVIVKSTTLDDFIEDLLLDGKNAKSPEFEQLMRLFGRDKIVEKALAAKKRIQEKRGSVK